MRQLQISQPLMRGTDIADWQTFLIKQDLLTDTADGIFGPDTAKASRAYQTQVGLVADGVIGPFTMARALDGGLTSTSGPLTPGMDTDEDCT
jgi:peptidoglycan hydrolase-like protein with peptidoglycan-binding domain